MERFIMTYGLSTAVLMSLHCWTAISSLIYGWSHELSKISHHVTIFKSVLNICFSTSTIPLNTNYFNIISYTSFNQTYHVKYMLLYLEHYCDHYTKHIIYFNNHHVFLNMGFVYFVDIKPIRIFHPNIGARIIQEIQWLLAAGITNLVPINKRKFFWIIH